MTRLHVALAKLRALIVRRRADRAIDQLDEEVQAHLDLLATDYERRGLSPGEARRAARRDFGGTAQMKEAYQDERGYRVIESFFRDARQGLRLLRRNPGFAVTAILSLGIAIGAATAVFAVVDSVFFLPMPVASPGELVIVKPRIRDRGWILPNPIFERLRSEQQSVSGMFAVNDVPYLRTRLDDGTGGYVRASLVSGSYFSVLGLSPSLGRLLTEQDDEVPQADTCAAVLSHAYWLTRFQADPQVLGRRMRANSAACVVVGVAPKNFVSHLTGYAPDLWLPIRPLTSRRDLDNYFGAFFSGVMARLKPGVGLEQAAVELTRTYQRIHEDHPPPPPGVPDERINPPDVGIRLAAGGRGFDTLRDQFGRALRILMALVAVVLLIAGVNVANVTLARGLARRPELATRRALGAGTGRLVAQLFSEGAVVVGAGTAIGLAIAAIGAPLLASFVTLSYKPIGMPVAANFRIVLFVAALSAVLTLIVAALPASRLSGSRTKAVVTTRWSTDSPATQRTLRALVVVQLALAVLLVTATGLLVKSLVGISRIDPGFRPDRVLLFNLDGGTRLSSSTEDVRAQRAALYRELEVRLHAIPGVEAVGLSWLGLFGGSDLWIPISYAGQPEGRPMVRVDYVSPRYFDSVGMRLVRGRGPVDEDRSSGLRGAVINEAMARDRFGGDAIGRQFSLDSAAAAGLSFTVVGIVADSKYNDVREGMAKPMMWLPLSEFGGIAMRSVTVRTTAGASASVGAHVREVLSSVDPELLVRRSTTLLALMDATLVRERLLFGLSVGFAGIAVLLSAIGLYGTLSQAFLRRRRELGVRLALGARPAALQRMVLASAARLVGAAVVIAAPVTLLAAGALQAFLFGVLPTDGVTLAASAAFVGLVALGAAYLPARRAASIDPVEVIRGE